MYREVAHASERDIWIPQTSERVSKTFQRAGTNSDHDLRLRRWMTIIFRGAAPQNVRTVAGSWCRASAVQNDWMYRKQDGLRWLGCYGSPKVIANTLYQVYEALANLLRSVNQDARESGVFAPSYIHAARLWKNDHVRCSSSYNFLMVACCLLPSNGTRNRVQEHRHRRGDAGGGYDSRDTDIKCYKKTKHE